MTDAAIDPHLDLTLSRTIGASPDAIWRAWTDPTLLERWWVPAPAQARVDRLDVRPGGGFVTSMREDGQDYVSHTDGIFLVIEPGQRLVFTNAISSSWRPAHPEPISMTAEIRLTESSGGTDYQVIVRHADPAARALHEELGFLDGWGAVTAALATLVEAASEPARSR